MRKSRERNPLTHKLIMCAGFLTSVGGLALVVWVSISMLKTNLQGVSARGVVVSCEPQKISSSSTTYLVTYEFRAPESTTEQTDQPEKLRAFRGWTTSSERWRPGRRIRVRYFPHDPNLNFQDTSFQTVKVFCFGVLICGLLAWLFARSWYRLRR